MNHLRRMATYVGTLLGVFAVWEILAAGHVVQPLLLASPSSVWESLRTLGASGSGLFDPVRVTLKEMVIAFCVSAVLAIPIGVLVGRVPVLYRGYEPLFTSVGALPLVILYPVLAATLGIGETSKIVLGTLYGFFPMIIATSRAAANVEPRFLIAAEAMGATQGQKIRSVVAPIITPAVLAGMRISIGLCLVTIIAAEFISGAAGIGYQLGAASQGLDTPTLFAWIVVACGVTIVVNLVFTTTTAVLQKGISR